MQSICYNNLLNLKQTAEILSYTYRGLWGSIQRYIKRQGKLPNGVYDIGKELGINKRILRINIQEFLKGTSELPKQINIANSQNCLKSFYQSSYFKNLSKSTYFIYTRAIALLNDFYKSDSIHIDHQSLHDFISFLRNEKKLQDISIKKYLKSLRTIFKQSKLQGYIKQNPLEDFEPNLLKKEIRIEYLRKHEREKLITSNQKIDPYVVNMLEFAIETGLRKSEQINLTWNNVNLTEKEIYITETKTKSNRVVPLSPKAFEILKHYKEKGVERPFFKITFERWKKTLERAEIRNTFRWHDLRHTFGTWCVKGWHDWLKAPLNLQQTASFMGHADIKMTTRYAHLDVSDLKNLIN